MTEGGLATASGESRASGITAAQVAVTNETLMHASKDEDNWLLYGRTYDNQRFSPLKQIDTRTVKDLVPVALIQTGIADTSRAARSRSTAYSMSLLRTIMCKPITPSAVRSCGSITRN